MPTKEEIVRALLRDEAKEPAKTWASAFAPSNMALIKYWGKRNAELNLPMTGSLSLSLGTKGAETQISLLNAPFDEVFLNGEPVDSQTEFYRRIAAMLTLLSPDPGQHYRIETRLNLPVAAGLASSACGFAALISAFADLYGWRLSASHLSILCRLASGSACRSLWQGFVEWHPGQRDDGLDSFAEPLPYSMPELALGLAVVSPVKKPLSSREAMNRTTATSILYAAWPKKIAKELAALKSALAAGDFASMGEISESNALGMHATMLSSTPPICYFLPETLALMHQIWALRAQGKPVYFTEDAGPNLTVLARKEDVTELKTCLPAVEWLDLAPDR